MSGRVNDLKLALTKVDDVAVVDHLGVWGRANLVGSNGLPLRGWGRAKNVKVVEIGLYECVLLGGVGHNGRF